MSRILTLVVEVDQPEADWIWESHLRGKINGVIVKSISNGDLAKKLDEARDDIYIMRKRLRYED